VRSHLAALPEGVVRAETIPTVVSWSAASKAYAVARLCAVCGIAGGASYEKLRRAVSVRDPGDAVELIVDKRVAAAP
jgi:hypothetical protein